jgi:ABC-type multidrug transport system fused ATPase/permease subunit
VAQDPRLRRPYKKHLIWLASLGALVGLFDIAYPLFTGAVIDELRAHETTGAHPRLGFIWL